MRPRRSSEHQRIVLERRRSSAASPIPSGKTYRRKPKHRNRYTQD